MSLCFLFVVSGLSGQPDQSLTASSASEDVGICQEMTNHVNTQYIATVNVGTPPQVLRVVPDTGSHELIVASTKCDECPTEKKKFDSTTSSTFEATGQSVETYFGQGNVQSIIGKDIVQIQGEGGTLSSDAITEVLEIQAQHISNWEKLEFDGVMGLAKEAKARKGPSGLSVLTSLNTQIFSLCYGREHLSPGVLMLNSAPILPEYKELPLKEHTNFWAVDMSSIQVSGSQSISLCTEGCTAIIDSGTSLFAAPAEHIDQIGKLLPDVAEDCSNIHELPALEFTLAGETFTVEPSSWVVKVKVDPATLPHSNPTSTLAANQPGLMISVCVPAFMQISTSEMDTEASWVFGMPFLREYAAKFDKGAKTISLAKTGPTTCSSCSSAQGHTATGSATSLMNTQVEPVEVTLSDVQTPSWAQASWPLNSTVLMLKRFKRLLG